MTLLQLLKTDYDSTEKQVFAQDCIRYVKQLIEKARAIATIDNYTVRTKKTKCLFMDFAKSLKVRKQKFSKLFNVTTPLILYYYNGCPVIEIAYILVCQTSDSKIPKYEYTYNGLAYLLSIELAALFSVYGKNNVHYFQVLLAFVELINCYFQQWEINYNDIDKMINETLEVDYEDTFQSFINKTLKVPEVPLTPNKKYHTKSSAVTEDVIKGYLALGMTKTQMKEAISKAYGLSSRTVSRILAKFCLSRDYKTKSTL